MTMTDRRVSTLKQSMLEEGEAVPSCWRAAGETGVQAEPAPEGLEPRSWWRGTGLLKSQLILW